MEPGALAVVIDLRCIGVGIVRVLQVEAPGGGAGPDLVMAAVETQVGLVLMAIEPRGIGFQLRRVGQPLFIGAQVGLPECRLALGRLDRLESFDKPRTFEVQGHDGPQPQQFNVQQHAHKTEHCLHFLFMAPFLDAVVELHDQLRGGDREHCLAEPGYQEQQVDPPVQQRAQARGAGLLVLVVRGHRADPGVVELLDRLQDAELGEGGVPQRAFLQLQAGLRGRLALPADGVEGVQAILEGTQECRLGAQVNIALEERLIDFIPQPFPELIVEGLERRIALDGLVRVTRQIGHARSLAGAGGGVMLDQQHALEQRAPGAAVDVRKVEQGQGVAVHGPVVPTGCLRRVEQAVQHLVSRLIQVTLDQGDLRLHRQFVALLVLEEGLVERAWVVARGTQEKVFDVPLVLAAEVEPATDGSEVRGRDGLFQGRGAFPQDGRAVVETECAGFAAFEVLQGGLQQALHDTVLPTRFAEGGGGEDMHVPELVVVNVQARAIVVVQGLGEQRRGKVPGAFETVQMARQCGFGYLAALEPRGECQASFEGSLGQPGGQSLEDQAMVPGRSHLAGGGGKWALLGTHEDQLFP